jgi:hypothetical protein
MNRIMIKPRFSFLRKFLRGFLYFLLFLLSVELIFYFTTPVFDFPMPEPFHGDSIYNPYRDMDSTHWIKGNFHFHTRAWAGLTSGRNNSNEVFWQTYKKLGYDIPCISNYMSISRFNQDSAFYIPAYEHGFGVRKKHQLCLGARKVLWVDYSLFQNLNQKQYILNRLKEQCELVAIAHPDWEGGYTPNDMKFLSGYDLIEVLDHNWRSVPIWDAALSSGHAAYILADDDAHDIYNPYLIGRCCTFINVPANRRELVIDALRNGMSFGADVYMNDEATFENKAREAKEIPKVTGVRVSHDTLLVTLSERAWKFDFIGQGGEVKKTMWGTSRGFYSLTPDDTYIRTEITFPNKYKGPGTKFYLNPVFRYDGGKPGNPLLAEVDFPRTWILRLLAIPALFAFIYIVLNFRRLRKIRKKE